jgi:hypothetical protein
LATTIDVLRTSSRLEATEKLTVPFPLPVVEDVNVIQVASRNTVHPHSLEVAMLRVAEPPLAPVPKLIGETSYRQGARWETRACSPFTRMAPSRAEAPSLAATRNDTVADPCPDAGDRAEIQSVVAAASHTHSGCVVTDSDPAPPTASSAGGVASVTRHFTGFGPSLTSEDVSQPETSTLASSTATHTNAPRCF